MPVKEMIQIIKILMSCGGKVVLHTVDSRLIIDGKIINVSDGGIFTVSGIAPLYIGHSEFDFSPNNIISIQVFNMTETIIQMVL